MSPSSHPTEDTPGGARFALLAYGSWGLVPLYWKALKHVPSPEILSHRVVWSTLLLLGLVAWRKQSSGLRASFLSARMVAVALVSATLIGVNWGIYIYAVTNGHVLESSLGYFINPLVNVALGVVFLGERLGRIRSAALLLAGIGVGVLVVSAGVFPWIALTLSLTFGFYGLVRKVSALPPLLGSTLESVLLTPLALLFLTWLGHEGSGHFTSTPSTPLLLVLGGAVTALPLLWFSEAAKRMPLATLGFFQFLSPTLQFLLAVVVFGETFTTSHAISFVFIWSALALNVWTSLQRTRPGT
ncbi:MAG: EamA family transporter RarD [Silvanigrellales bacterium]|nr:EamA family transporter RarD [Silvanigrellales bacterium]